MKQIYNLLILSILIGLSACAGSEKWGYVGSSSAFTRTNFHCIVACDDTASLCKNLAKANYDSCINNASVQQKNNCNDHFDDEKFGCVADSQICRNNCFN